jgi:hypothetical protein
MANTTTATKTTDTTKKSTTSKKVTASSTHKGKRQPDDDDMNDNDKFTFKYTKMNNRPMYWNLLPYVSIYRYLCRYVCPSHLSMMDMDTN